MPGDIMRKLAGSIGREQTLQPPQVTMPRRVPTRLPDGVKGKAGRRPVPISCHAPSPQPHRNTEARGSPEHNRAAHAERLRGGALSGTTVLGTPSGFHSPSPCRAQRRFQSGLCRGGHGENLQFVSAVQMQGSNCRSPRDRAAEGEDKVSAISSAVERRCSEGFREAGVGWVDPFHSLRDGGPVCGLSAPFRRVLTAGCHPPYRTLVTRMM